MISRFAFATDAFQIHYFICCFREEHMSWLSRLWAVGALLAACPSLAAEWPTRKAGLWDIKMIAGEGSMPAMTMQQCTDATTDKEMTNGLGPMTKEMCSKNDIEKTATGYVTNSVCNVGGRTSTSRAEIVGDFNSAYTMKVLMHTDNPPAGVPADSKMTLDAKWVGACKADQKPGDVVMPGGMKMNIKDMQALRGQKK